MSSRPAASVSIRVRKAATSAGDVKSQRIGTPRPPAASISSAVSSMVSTRFIGEEEARVVRPVA